MTNRIPAYLALAGALAMAVIAIAGTACAEDPATEKTRDGWQRVETLHPDFAQDGTLSVVNINGEITVVPSAEGVLQVTVRKEVRPRHPRWSLFRSSPNGNLDDAEAALDALAIRVSGDPAGLRLETGKLPKDSKFSGTVHYTVELPEHAAAHLSTTNGKVSVSGTGKEISAASTNGKIDLERIAGPVTAKTINGSISVERASGPVTAHTTNGAIEVRGLRASLDAESTNGGIHCGFDGPLPREATVQCHTSNGGITLVAAPESTFAIRASTANGRIHSDFPLTITGSIRPKQVDAVIGEGGADVTLKTTNGSITLARG